MHAPTARPLTTAIALLAALLLGTTAGQAGPRATETGFIQVEEDVQLFYQRFGTGTPTLFVPNRLVLVTTFGDLFERLDVVTWDPRGRGLSSRPDDASRYGIDAEIADAEALRSHFGAETITYLGTSVWANVGLHYAARAPAHVARVIALGPLPIAQDRMGPPDDPIAHDLSSEVAELAAMVADGRAERDPYTHCALDFFVRLSSSYATLDRMAPLLEANVCQYANERQVGGPPMRGMSASLGAWDWTTLAGTLRAPVLLAFGTRENWPIAGVRAYADALPDVGIAAFEGAGHHVWNERQAEITAMVEAFAAGEWPEGVERRATTAAGRSPDTLP